MGCPLGNLICGRNESSVLNVKNERKNVIQCYDFANISIGCLNSKVHSRSVSRSPSLERSRQTNSPGNTFLFAVAPDAAVAASFPESGFDFGGGGGPLFVLDFLEGERESESGGGEMQRAPMFFCQQIMLMSVPYKTLTDLILVLEMI